MSIEESSVLRQSLNIIPRANPYLVLVDDTVSIAESVGGIADDLKKASDIMEGMAWGNVTLMWSVRPVQVANIRASSVFGAVFAIALSMEVSPTLV